MSGKSAVMQLRSDCPVQGVPMPNEPSPVLWFPKTGCEGEKPVHLLPRGVAILTQDRVKRKRRTGSHAQAQQADDPGQHSDVSPSLSEPAPPTPPWSTRAARANGDGSDSHPVRRFNSPAKMEAVLSVPR